MKKSVLLGVTILGAQLGGIISTAHADGMYSDNHLHRSDEMIRFDRAYMQGLKDGSPTVIYYQEHEAEPEWLGRNEPADKDGRYPNKNQMEPGKPIQQLAAADTSRSAQAAEERIRQLKEAKAKLEESRRIYEAATAGQDTTAQIDGAVVKVDAESQTVAEVKPAAPAAASLLTETPLTLTPEEAPLTKFELEPDLVKNQRVSIHMTGTIEDIATAMLPRGWTLKMSVSDASILKQTFEFISTEPRDVALRDLLRGTPLGYKYFFTLVDKAGKPAPVLVIAGINEA